MGADLYIKNLDRQKQYTGFEVSNDAVEVGYFRDCYNSYGLFNFLRSNLNDENWSWWQLVDQKKKWFDKEGNMKQEGAKEFLQMAKKAKDKLTKIKKYELDVYNFDKGKDEKKKLNKEETKEYLDWLNLLIKFLELSIKLKSPIIWSV